MHCDLAYYDGVHDKHPELLSSQERLHTFIISEKFPTMNPLEGFLDLRNDRCATTSTGLRRCPT